MRFAALVVDDNLSVREALKLTLEDDYLIYLAASVREAFTLLDRSHVDMVLLDFKMPGMNGIDFLKQLAHRWPHVPVVMITATTDIALAAETFHHGAVDYLTKPFDVFRVQACVRQVAGRKAHERQLAWRKLCQWYHERWAGLPDLQQWCELQCVSLRPPSLILLSGGSAAERLLVAVHLTLRQFGEAQPCLLTDSEDFASSDRYAALLTEGLWYIDTARVGQGQVAPMLRQWQSIAPLPQWVLIGESLHNENVLDDVPLDRAVQCWDLPSIDQRYNDQTAAVNLPGVLLNPLQLGESWPYEELQFMVNGAS